MIEVKTKVPDHNEKWSHDYADRLYAVDLDIGGSIKAMKWRAEQLEKFGKVMGMLVNGATLKEATGWDGEAKVVIDRETGMVGYIQNSGFMAAHYLYPKGAVAPADPATQALWPWGVTDRWEFSVWGSTRVMIYEERISSNR